MKSITWKTAWVWIGLLIGSGSARADLIPWMYNWTSSPDQVMADAPGTGYISLTDEPNRLAVGSSDIVATNLRTFSTATTANPDRFTNKPYSLGLMLYDLESGQSTVVTFAGVLNGQLTAQSSNISNSFTGLTTHSVVLGSNRYTATITSYTPPGPPGATNPGAIGATATVTVEAMIPEVPEPGTLTLLGVGVGLVGWCRWRRPLFRP
ncbi:MAG: PEP-CTERM sorting domain-containing protein [Gemmataceae bacterium]